MTKRDIIKALEGFGDDEELEVNGSEFLGEVRRMFPYKDPEPMITYAHRQDPKGIRFRAYAKDALPPWAVDVKPEPTRG